MIFILADLVAADICLIMLIYGGKILKSISSILILLLIVLVLVIVDIKEGD